MRLGQLQIRHRPMLDQPLSARRILAFNMVRLRGLLGWSQERLALEAGLDRSFVAQVERESRNVSIDNIEKIAHALSVPVHKLLISE